MHTTAQDGSVIESRCDFCQRIWDPEGSEIMIEGHQGSLVCLKCLSLAYADVVLHGGGFEHQGKTCTLCLEERNQPEWESPIENAQGVCARLCLRCMKQAATALEKDKESGWERPGGKRVGAAGQIAAEDEE